MRRLVTASAVLLLVPAVSLGAVAPVSVPSRVAPTPIVARANATLTERATIKLLNVKDRLSFKVRTLHDRFQAKWPAWLPREKVAAVAKGSKGFGFGVAAAGLVTMNPLLISSGFGVAWAGGVARRLALPDEPRKENPLFKRFATGGRIAMFGMRMFGFLSRRAGLAGLVGGGLLMNPWIAGGGLLLQASGGIVRALNHRLELKRAQLLGTDAPEAPDDPVQPEPFAKRLAVLK